MQKRALVTLFISMFVVMVGMACIAPFLSIYASEFGATGLQVSLIFAGFSISRTFFAPFMGSLSDKHKRRNMLIIGLSAYTLVSFTYIFARGPVSLFIDRFLQGMAGAMVFPVVLAYVGEISPKDKEGFYMGIINIAFFAGLGCGPLLGGIIYDTISIRATFYFTGLFSTLALIMAIIFLPKDEPWRQKHQRPLRFIDREILRIPMIQGIGIFRMATSFGVGLNWVFLPLYADKVLNLTGSQIGAVISINVMIGAIIQGPAGFLADRSNRRNIIFFAGIFLALCLLMIPTSKGFWDLFIINLLVGFANGISLPAIMSLTILEGKKVGMGSVMGTVTFFHSFGMILGLVCGGLMFDLFGFSPAYFVAAVVGILGTGAFLNREKVNQNTNHDYE